jgi:hypothetical protein
MRKTHSIFSVLFFFIVATAAYGANYVITAQTIDAGGTSGQSTSYHLLGKVRGLALSTPSSTHFIVGEGFLRRTYVSHAILAPIVTGIEPSSWNNTGTVNVTVSGANFATGAAVKLSMVGQLDIAATNVVVATSKRITCTFDINGAALGLWTVTVTNTDTRSGSLAAFRVTSPSPSFKVTVPVKSEKNPFDPRSGTTKLKYSLSQDHEITIYIFDIRGQRIWEYRAAAGEEGGKEGANEVIWDGITAFGSSASNGVYLVHVTARIGGQIKTISTTKIALIKQ